MSVDKDRMAEFIQDIRTIAVEWGPMGVMSDPDWPRDEYDCIIGPVASMLMEHASMEEIDTFLKNELRHHFGTDPASDSAPESLAIKAKEVYDKKWKDRV